MVNNRRYLAMKVDQALCFVVKNQILYLTWKASTLLNAGSKVRGKKLHHKNGNI